MFINKTEYLNNCSGDKYFENHSLLILLYKYLVMHFVTVSFPVLSKWTCYKLLSVNLKFV